MRILAFVIFISMSSCLYAIEVRTPDFIRYEGKTFAISNNPLEPYFKLYPEITPKPDVIFLETNKQYTAIYEIQDSMLFLVELNISMLAKDSSYNQVNVISEVFKGKQKVKMDWFSTSLIIEPIYFTPEGNDGSYKDGQYRILKIQDGKLISRKNATESQVNKLKHQLFKEFAKTEQYKIIHEQYDTFKKSEIEEIVIGDKILDYTSKVEIKKTSHNNG